MLQHSLFDTFSLLVFVKNSIERKRICDEAV